MIRSATGPRTGVDTDSFQLQAFNGAEEMVSVKRSVADVGLRPGNVVLTAHLAKDAVQRLTVDLEAAKH